MASGATPAIAGSKSQSDQGLDSGRGATPAVAGIRWIQPGEAFSLGQPLLLQGVERACSDRLPALRATPAGQGNHDDRATASAISVALRLSHDLAYLL